VQHGVVPVPVVLLGVADRELGVQDGFVERAAPVLDLPEKAERLGGPEGLTADGALHRGGQVPPGPVEVVGPQPDHPARHQATHPGRRPRIVHIGQFGERVGATPGQRQPERPGEPRVLGHPRRSCGGHRRGAVGDHLVVGLGHHGDDRQLGGDPRLEIVRFTRRAAPAFADRRQRAAEHGPRLQHLTGQHEQVARHVVRPRPRLGCQFALVPRRGGDVADDEQHLERGQQPATPRRRRWREVEGEPQEDGGLQQPPLREMLGGRPFDVVREPRVGTVRGGDAVPDDPGTAALCGQQVQVPALCPVEVVVHQPADQRAGEREVLAQRAGHLLEQPRVDRLGDRVDRDVGQPACLRQAEPAAGHRARGDQTPGRRPARGEPCPHRRRDSARRGKRAVPEDDGVHGQFVEQMPDVQRMAPGVLVQAGGSRRRQTRVTGGHREPHQVRRRQAGQVEPGAPARVEQAAPPVVEFGGLVDHDDQQGLARQPPDGEPDRGHRQPVRPLRVVDHDHLLGALEVGRQRVRGEDRARRAVRRSARRELREHRPRQLGLLLVTAGPHHGGSSRGPEARGIDEVADQRGLPDPGRAPDPDDADVPAARRVPHPVQDREFTTAAHESDFPVHIHRHMVSPNQWLVGRFQATGRRSMP
jgi:hypothetical protein